MNFEQVRAFRLTTELGSFSKAAQELFLTQPAVSLQIRRLEQELGVDLFAREGKRLKLSPAGALFLTFAGQVERQLADLKRALAELPPLTRTLTIGTGSTTAKYLLPPLLAAYRARAPHTHVNVLVLPLAQVSARLVRGELDFGVLVRPFIPPALTAEPLLRERLLLVAPPSHPLARRPLVTPEEIAAYPFVALPPALATADLMYGWAASHAIAIQVVMEIDSYDALKEAVLRGLGIALIAEASVADDIHRGRLAVVQGPDLPLRRTLYLAYRREATLGEAACLLLDTVRSGEWQLTVASITDDEATGISSRGHGAGNGIRRS